MTLVLIPLLPLAAALASLIPVGWPLAAAVTLASAASALLLAWRVTLLVLERGVLIAVPSWLGVDGLAALLLLLIAVVGSTAALYSWGYMARAAHAPARLRLYYVHFNLFLFSMLSVPVLLEPNLVWIAVELTTLLSVLLVSFENTHAALEAAWKYVVLTLMGASIALVGFLILHYAMGITGSGLPYTWQGLAAAAPQMPTPLLRLAFVLVLVGFGAKVGLVPLHTWLPDAHSQAPSPVCALLSGVETSAVLYVVLRLLPLLRGAPGQGADAWALTFGLVSTGAAAFLLLGTRSYKRLFAFSTVEHMGIILTAAGFGAAAQYAATYQMLAHALTKSLCFYAAGAVLLAAGTQEIDRVRGLIHTSPLAGAALLLGGLGIAGAPPFVVFLSEFAVLRAGIVQGQYLAAGLLALFVAVAFFGILFHVTRMVFGSPAGDGTPFPALPVTCTLTLLLAMTPVFALGVYLPRWLHDLLRLAAGSLGG